MKRGERLTNAVSGKEKGGKRKSVAQLPRIFILSHPSELFRPLARAERGDKRDASGLSIIKVWDAVELGQGDATGAAEGERVGGGGGDNNQSRLNVLSPRSTSPPYSRPPTPRPRSSRERLIRKLYLHTVPIACLITCATFIDRANLALAAPGPAARHRPVRLAVWLCVGRHVRLLRALHVGLGADVHRRFR